MKCPYCEYEESEATYDREKGKFWELSNHITLERRCDFMEDQEAYLLGCPACKRIFLSDFK